MIYDIKEFLKSFFTSRLFVLGLIICLLFTGVIARVFTLQIINGKSYQENFTLKIQKDLTIEATRGNIYDSEGRLLAYNEMSYSVVFSDNGSYSSTSEKNRILNAELAEIIQMLLDKNETIYNEFGITLNADGSYSYNVTGTSLKTFLVNVFGASSFDELSYNSKFGFNEATATPDQVMDYLMHDSNHFGINLEPTEKNPEPDHYSDEVAYYITVLRYAILENRYSRYLNSVVAKNVSDRTVAYINEHSDTLKGASIQEETIRKYNYSEYFSGIIGYTGKISESEYLEYHEKDSSYTINDNVGRSGLEAYYESYLRGVNGEQSVYVDNVGRISKVISETNAIAGQDVYISIDAELQEATYKLLEQEIAGVVYANIQSNDIPINDVYFALIKNGLINIDHFGASDASELEKSIYNIFENRLTDVTDRVYQELYSSTPTVNNDMPEDMLDYVTYIIKYLKNSDVLLSKEIDMNDSVYINWRDGKISPQEYLKYCISKQWIDITLLDVSDKYADSSEIYDALVTYIINDLKHDTAFNRLVYNYLVHDGSVSGRDLCLILYDQGVLDYDDNYVNMLSNGSMTAYQFMLDKIDNIEITPAQLALDPCTGSCVITDVNTGQIRALVSYPGYDINKMANGVDADYYAKLQSDLSNPLYNYATQEKTACGSTFKMITSAASLAENIITTDTEIECTGVYRDFDGEPHCWIYPSNHGMENVSEAIKDSCNIFFYTCGFNLSSKDYGVYDDKSGIQYIQKYAKMFGLDQKTGVEIEENKSDIATEYPVVAAIGQSDNNYTTIALSRYVTAICSGNLYDYQLMDKIVDTSGNVVEQYKPSSTSVKSILNDEQWNSIYGGMRMVVEDLSSFNGLQVACAGKTGTAQQVATRPNHALFVGYAPYENPEISIATRIAFGYTSHNAAGFSANVFSYYFGEETLDAILDKKASGANVSSSSEGFTD